MRLVKMHEYYKNLTMRLLTPHQASVAWRAGILLKTEVGVPMVREYMLFY